MIAFFFNNASPDKLINQIFLNLKCRNCEPIWAPQKKKKKKHKKQGCVGTSAFTTAKALSPICFGFLLFILWQRGPSTKLLITEWTAVMSPDATQDFLFWEENNLMFDLRFKKKKKKNAAMVTIWWEIQLVSPFIIFVCHITFFC